MTPIGHALLNAMYEIKYEKDQMRKMEGAWITAYIDGLNKAQRVIVKHLEYELERLEEMERKTKNEKIL